MIKFHTSWGFENFNNSRILLLIISTIALVWGILDGEKNSFPKFILGLVILLGDYLVNKSK